VLLARLFLPDMFYGGAGTVKSVISLTMSFPVLPMMTPRTPDFLYPDKGLCGSPRHLIFRIIGIQLFRQLQQLEVVNNKRNEKPSLHIRCTPCARSMLSKGARIRSFMLRLLTKLDSQGKLERVSQEQYSLLELVPVAFPPLQKLE
jgi:hypothetical protein